MDTAGIPGKNSEGVSLLRNKRLFIYCAGGLGREVLRLSRRINRETPRWDKIAFIDDHFQGSVSYDAEVWDFPRYLREREDGDSFVIATGETVLRKALWEKLSQNGCRLETLVHPSVYVDDYDRLGEGCVLTEGVVLGGYDTFGRCCYVNLGCTVGHNAVVGDFSTLSPGAIVSGNVTIGEGTYIGTGAIIRDEVTIGKNCIIGMGSLVTKDIPDHVVAYGAPSRVVRENTDGIVFR